MQQKEQTVKRVFNSVFDKYDFMNDIMSLGIHRLWKKELIYLLNPSNNSKLIDVGSGTGDIGKLFFRATNGKCKILCIDPNDNMIKKGKKNLKNFKNIQWKKNRAEKLRCSSNYFDYYTISFGLRNTSNLDKSISEAYRVLKPGGRFLCLEFSKIQNSNINFIFKNYSKIIPSLGKMVVGKKEPYEYLGRLKYINHDNERENPVWFQWQLIDFKSDEITTPEKEQNYDGIEKIGSLLFSDDKPLSKKAGVTQQSFKAKKAPDYARKDSENRALGLEGEELVIKYEQKYLNDMNRADLAEKIIHVSKVEGDGAGYDIRSYDKNGEVKYIEVKTTRGNINTDFYMSPREIAFSQINEKNYYLYRVYDLKKQTNNGKFYIIKGDIEAHFNKTPTGFRLSKK